MEGYDKGKGPSPKIYQAMILQSSSIRSLSTFLCEAMKDRKALPKYVVIKNLHFNIIKESDLESMLREDFFPNFKKFLIIIANTILLNIIQVKKKVEFHIFQILILQII